MSRKLNESIRRGRRKHTHLVGQRLQINKKKLLLLTRECFVTELCLDWRYRRIFSLTGDHPDEKPTSNVLRCASDRLGGRLTSYGWINSVTQRKFLIDGERKRIELYFWHLRYVEHHRSWGDRPRFGGQWLRHACGGSDLYSPGATASNRSA